MDFDSAQAYHPLVHGGQILQEIVHVEIMVCIIHYTIYCSSDNKVPQNPK